jgi:CheY-like chemotaxis protein
LQSVGALPWPRIQALPLEWLEDLGLGLPDFSGVEVCERLRAGGSTTPVLMLTAHDDVAERVRAQLRRGSRNGS